MSWRPNQMPPRGPQARVSWRDRFSDATYEATESTDLQKYFREADRFVEAPCGHVVKMRERRHDGCSKCSADKLAWALSFGGIDVVPVKHLPPGTWYPLDDRRIAMAVDLFDQFSRSISGG